MSQDGDSLQVVVDDVELVLSRHEPVLAAFAVARGAHNAYNLHFCKDALFSGLPDGAHVQVEIPDRVLQLEAEALSRWVGSQLLALRGTIENLATLHLNCTTLEAAVHNLLRDNAHLSAILARHCQPRK